MQNDGVEWLQREMLLGFWKIHILQHAAEHVIYGQWMSKELRHHGYDVSPGTLYPMLSRMSDQGLIVCKCELAARTRGRREYRITMAETETRRFLKRQVQEQSDEVVGAGKKNVSRQSIRATACGQLGISPGFMAPNG